MISFEEFSRNNYGFQGLASCFCSHGTQTGTVAVRYRLCYERSCLAHISCLGHHGIHFTLLRSCCWHHSNTKPHLNVLPM